MSYETRYAAAARQRADAAASTPEAAAARLRWREAMQRACADVAEQFPDITPENFGDALDFKNDRFNYWRQQLSA